MKAASRKAVVGGMKRMAKKQAARRKDGPRPLSPSEQMRRYLNNEEYWRVEAGLVTPEQFDDYQKAMRKLIVGRMR